MLYTFTCGTDGCEPFGGVTLDAFGNLYGTTASGGDVTSCYAPGGCGVVFELSPNLSGGWTETVLHTFEVSDGLIPSGNLIFDFAGNLYGTTVQGGNISGCVDALAYFIGCGVVYELSPSEGKWAETVLYEFPPGSSINGGYQGAFPYQLTMDAIGNLYGTAAEGGRGGEFNIQGVIFKLYQTPTGWKETVLHAFFGGTDGGSSSYFSNSGITIDPAGNLFGVAGYGGNLSACCSDGFAPFGCGVVYEIEQ